MFYVMYFIVFTTTTIICSEQERTEDQAKKTKLVKFCDPSRNIVFELSKSCDHEHKQAQKNTVKHPLAKLPHRGGSDTLDELTTLEELDVSKDSQ